MLEGLTSQKKVLNDELIAAVKTVSPDNTMHVKHTDILLIPQTGIKTKCTFCIKLFHFESTVTGQFTCLKVHTNINSYSFAIYTRLPYFNYMWHRDCNIGNCNTEQSQLLKYIFYYIRMTQPFNVGTHFRTKMFRHSVDKS